MARLHWGECKALPTSIAYDTIRHMLFILIVMCLISDESLLSGHNIQHLSRLLARHGL